MSEIEKKNEEMTEQEKWIKEKMEKDQAEARRKANVDEWLNDPDQNKKVIKKKVYEEHMKERLEKNPKIADSKEMLSEIYLMKLETMQKAEEAGKETPPKTETEERKDDGTLIPPAVDPKRDPNSGDGALFNQDGTINKKKVDPTTAALARGIGMNIN